MNKNYILCRLKFFDDDDTEFECDPYYLGENTIKGKVGGDELTLQTVDRLNHWVATYEGICRRDDLSLLGRHLYVLAFGSGKTKIAFEKCYDYLRRRKASGEDIGLKLYLEFYPEVKMLSTLPWEFLYMPLHKDDGRFLAGEETELVLTRFVPEKDGDLIAEKGKEKLRILVVLSQPAELSNVRADSLITSLKKSLQVEVHLQERPTRSSLEAEINNFNPHILHFIGHGDAGKLALIQDEAILAEARAEYELQKSQGKAVEKVAEADWVDSKTLRGFFINKPPKVVFLHACKGESTVFLERSIQSFNSTARDLAYNTSIPAVIAMQYEISNDAAETFATSFYQQIREGRSIDEAVTIARNILGKKSFLPNRYTWDDRSFGTPVIYLQTRGHIIDPPPPEGSTEEQGEQIGTGGTPPQAKQPCPNPECNGKVAFGSKFCSTCHKRILVCTNCNKRMVAEENPFCDECGYDPGVVGTARETAVKEAAGITGPGGA